MNILFLTGVFPGYGGVESVTRVLANEFTGKGHHVWIASFEQETVDAHFKLDASVRLIALSYPVWRSRNTKLLSSLIDTKAMDIIINQWCLPYYVTTLCKNAIGSKPCKLISVLHNTPDKNARIASIEAAMQSSKQNSIKNRAYYPAKRWLTRAFIQWSMRDVYRRSDRYVLLSESFKSSFKAFTGIKNPEKLSFIPNLNTLTPSGKTTIEKENLILYVGRLDFYQKRVHRIIELWEDIYNDYPDWRLSITGDGNEKADLQHYVENRQIKRVEFTGNRNPSPYYEKAKLLLLTSEFEGFGLVITEGMSFGVVPVVYGSYSAVYDIIEHQQDGVIIPKPYNKETAKKLVTGLMNDTKQLDRVAAKARQKVKVFDRSTIISHWEHLFTALHNSTIDQ
ncbi:glycosyltransferase [Saccharicrinis sp. FJH54]|uniref:glycosyltransferase n=1 Tax=Saccharicrinis sp. FJH54 TaxID=3344665 RepID=UPI0035D40B00